MKITTLKEFQDKFNSVLNTVNEKQALVEAELKDIDNYLNADVMSFYKFRKKSLFAARPKKKHLFELDISDYNRDRFAQEVKEFSIHGKELDLDSIYGEIYKDVSIQACEFSKYIKWLRELNREYNSKPQPKKPGLSPKQKMLALHYLGLNLGKYENTDSGKVLSQILDLDYDNTRKYLSYVAAGKNDVRTKDNFEALVKLFDVQGFEEVKDEILKDSEKLS